MTRANGPSAARAARPQLRSQRRTVTSKARRSAIACRCGSACRQVRVAASGWTRSFGRACSARWVWLLATLRWYCARIATFATDCFPCCHGSRLQTEIESDTAGRDRRRLQTCVSLSSVKPAGATLDLTPTTSGNDRLHNNTDTVLATLGLHVVSFIAASALLRKSAPDVHRCSHRLLLSRL